MMRILYARRGALACVVLLTGGLTIFARDVPTYDPSGMRDPMVRPVEERTESPVPETEEARTREREDRTRELQDFIARARIEGVVVSQTQRVALVNDRPLTIGEAVADDSHIYIANITAHSIVFRLDSYYVTYYLIHDDTD